MEKTIQTDKAIKSALISLVFNIAFGIYHIILGIVTYSWWLITIGIYYAILSIARFVVLGKRDKKRHIAEFTGIMLIALSVSLVVTVILALVKDRGKELPLIAMLAIAIYTFAKIILAAIKWTKARKSRSQKIKALRNISLASAFVSVFSLQRSMLVSFQGMAADEIRVMNFATGSAVCVIVFLLGIGLMQRKNTL